MELKPTSHHSTENSMTVAISDESTFRALDESTEATIKQEDLKTPMPFLTTTDDLFESTTKQQLPQDTVEEISTTRDSDLIFP